MAPLRQLCEFTNTWFQEITGDGNCLYRCVAKTVFSTEQSWQLVRRQCVNDVASRWDEVRDCFVHNGTCAYRSRHDYLNKNLEKRKDVGWEYATDVEIQAAAKLFQTNIMIIHVFKSKTGERKSSPLLITCDPKYKKTLCIRCQNPFSASSHYNWYESMPIEHAKAFRAALLETSKANGQSYGGIVLPGDVEIGQPAGPKTPPARPNPLGSQTVDKKRVSAPLTPTKRPQNGGSSGIPPKIGKKINFESKVQPSVKAVQPACPKTPPALPNPPGTPPITKNKVSAPLTPTKRPQPAVFSGIPPKIGKKINFVQDSDFESKNTKQMVDVTSSLVRPAIDFVFYDQFEDATVDEPCSNAEIPQARVKDTVKRPKPWAALPHISKGMPAMTMVQKYTSKYYFAAAQYGDEKWSLLKPLILPKMDIECRHCKALFRCTELYCLTARPCCKNNEDNRKDEDKKTFVVTDEKAKFKKPSKLIESLYTNKHPKSVPFKRYISRYNRMFSTVQFIRKHKTHKVYGNVHMISVNGQVTFEPNAFKSIKENNVLTPGQIYFIDTDHDTVQHRMATRGNVDDIDQELVTILSNYLHSKNGFVQCFTTTRELQEQENQKALAEGREPAQLILAVNPRPRQRTGYRVAMENVVNHMLDEQYSRPCSDFVAAVYYGKPNNIHYDTFYVPRERSDDDDFPRLEGSEKTLDVQMFPLLHLHGENSWLNMTVKDEDKSATLRQYYNFRLQVRRDESFNPLYWSGKLFAEYLISAAIRIEKMKLDFLAKSENQKILKVTSYKILRKYVESQASKLGKTVGKFVLLPKTFVNSPRWRQDRFYNGMAMARKFGPPTYFVTQTCNPDWPEIKEVLQPGQTWMDRPDIVCRIFRDRRRHLLSDLVNKQILGRVQAWFVSDEFQKCSLPHAHILLFIVDEDKPQCGEDVDRIISAEIPDKNHPAYNIVIQNMLHHGCHKWKKETPPPCFADGKKCRFGFPKPFAESTDIDSRFVVLRRRIDGRQVRCKKTGVLLDNRNVVGHNLYCLIRDVGHINFEYCKTTVECFKYLCIYLNKGPDHAYVSLTDQNTQKKDLRRHYEWDEISHYREMRYMNAAEAVYSIKSYDLGQQSHAVMVLSFHLPDEHAVIFVEGSEAEAVENIKESMLIKYFELNQRACDLEAQNKSPPKDPRHLLYVDMPTEYLWDKRNKNWKKRQKNPNIGRLGIVVPTQETLEVYHLRMLLMNIPGATSFEHLRTVNGVLRDSFTEACKAYGLIEDDLLPFQILTELSTVLNANRLRYNFALILKWTLPHKPIDLWEQFKDTLSDDLQPRHQHPAAKHHNLALHLIKQHLDDLSVDYETTGLPKIDVEMCSTCEAPPQDDVIITEVSYNTSFNQLKAQQKFIFNLVIDKLNKEEVIDNVVLVLGAGGVGKTFLYNTIIKYCKIHNIRFGASAYTGIAATLLINGQTAHKLFGIPIHKKDAEHFLSTLPTESARAKHLKEVKILIIDEVSMFHSWQLNLIDKFLRKLTGIDKPYGSKLCLLSGDLRQTLPVTKRGSREQVVESCIINSEIWPNLVIYEMTQNIRAEGDQEFAQWLLEVGNGEANHPGTPRLDLPTSLYRKDLSALVKSTFPNGPLNTLGDEVILTPRNDTMRDVNEIIAMDLPGQTTTYFAAHKFTPDNTWSGTEMPITHDLMQEINAANLPPHKLNLKVGAIVMLLVNLDVNCGLCNGARFRVVACMQHTVKCERLSGTPELKAEPVYLFKVLISKDDVGLPGLLTRRQYPIRLAFCVTINKSQGSTYNRVGLHLPASCFAHGQLYVGVARTKKFKSLFVHVRNSSEQGFKIVNKKVTLLFTRNEVYKEVLIAVYSHPNYHKLTME